MTRSLLLVSIAAAVLLSANAARADTPSLAAALDARDPLALKALAAQSDHPDQATLARGSLEALSRLDDAAIRDLEASATTSSLGADLRRTALNELANLWLRQGRFADAKAAFESANTFGPDPNPAHARDNAQSLDFARVAAHTPAMTASAVTPGSLPITRDMAQLARADVVIGSSTENAVLDTGANYSTITEGAARRVGVHVLDGQIMVTSSVSEATPSRVGVADRVTFGGVEYHNVVFAVLPDESLSFAGGRYKIDVIVGLPVLMHLGRLAFAADAQGETLSFGPSPDARGPDSNFWLDGLEPFATVSVDNAPNPLTMEIDSGARTSQLNHDRRANFAALLDGASTHAVSIGGAGGTLTQQASVVPHLTVHVGAQTVTLDDVEVIDGPSADQDGVIGQDVLRSHGGGYVLDFDAMRFELTPPPPH